MNEFFSWGALGTNAGALLATTLIVQLFKGVRFVSKIPPRILSYIVAFAVLLMAQFFTEGASLSGAGLSLINAAVVSLASNGAYDTACKFNMLGKGSQNCSPNGGQTEQIEQTKQTDTEDSADSGQSQ